MVNILYKERMDFMENKLLIWMIYTQNDYKKNKVYYNMHKEKGQEMGLDIKLIFLEDLSFGIENNIHYINYKNQTVELPIGVIMRSRYAILSRQFEYMGIKVFNNSYVCNICNDKAKTYQLLGEIGIDIIPSRFVINESIDNIINDNIYNKQTQKDSTDNESKTTEYIIKTVNGHGGNEVFKLRDYKENVHSKKTVDMVIQPLIDKCNKDVRVYVLNNSILAAVERCSSNDFRSNYSLGGSVKEYFLKENEKEIVERIIKLFKEETTEYDVRGLFYVGIDFLVDSNGRFIFNEIEDVVGSRMLYKVKDIDVVWLYLQEIYKSVCNKRL